MNVSAPDADSHTINAPNAVRAWADCVCVMCLAAHVGDGKDGEEAVGVLLAGEAAQRNHGAAEAQDLREETTGAGERIGEQLDQPSVGIDYFPSALITSRPALNLLELRRVDECFLRQLLPSIEHAAVPLMNLRPLRS